MAKKKEVRIGTFQPIIDRTFFDVEKDGEIPQLRYMSGNPLNYRFDAGKGVFNMKGTKSITEKPGAELKLIPIAYRIFKDRLFNYDLRDWLEIFFVNGKGAVCVLTFHGYSVTNFIECLSDLFYEDCPITEAVLTISPKEKKCNTEGEAFGKKYFIAEFEAEPLEAEDAEIFKTVCKDLKFYRHATVLPTNKMVNSLAFPLDLIEVTETKQIDTGGENGEGEGEQEEETKK